MGQISSEGKMILEIFLKLESCFFFLGMCVSYWLLVGLGPGGLDSWNPPYERHCYLRAPFESQTTGPQTNN